MVVPTCSRCGRTIASDDVNVANDVAYCRPCNLSHKLSELTQGAELTADLDLTNPPAGAWHRSDGVETVIGATHRSLGAAAVTLGISLFWNGIVSVFVLLAVASTLRHWRVPVPDWFPAPVMNDSPMSVGMTIFLWIFLTPFIVIGLAMIAAFLSAIGGRTEVRITNAKGSVFSGIGPMGYARRFDASSVTDVRIDDNQWRDSDGDRHRKTHIVIETQQGKRIKFGSALSEERRKFVAGAIRKGLVR